MAHRALLPSIDVFLSQVLASFQHLHLFAKHHFYIVYDTDLGEPLADGFYFTVSYPNMTGSNLMRNLLFYGISAISLNTTGSTQEGLRICTSFVNDSQYDDLDYKLSCFNTDFPI